MRAGRDLDQSNQGELVQTMLDDQRSNPLRLGLLGAVAASSHERPTETDVRNWSLIFIADAFYIQMRNGNRVEAHEHAEQALANMQATPAEMIRFRNHLQSLVDNNVEIDHGEGVLVDDGIAMPPTVSPLNYASEDDQTAPGWVGVFRIGNAYV